MDVLFIEPDNDLAAMFVAMTKKNGIRANSVRTGQDAIITLDKEPYKLVCLEVHLLGHNGFEFLHELRSYPEWSHIKVILLTFVPEPDLQLSKQQMKQLGIARYFYKPRVNLKQLSDFIKQEIS